MSIRISQEELDETSLRLKAFLLLDQFEGPNNDGTWPVSHSSAVLFGVLESMRTRDSFNRDKLLADIKSHTYPNSVGQDILNLSYDRVEAIIMKYLPQDGVNPEVTRLQVKLEDMQVVGQFE